MKKIFNILILLSILTSSYAQQKYTISGYVTDKSSGESIVGTNIYSKDLNVGVSSNTYGFYSLTLPEGTHNISFSFIGYKRIDKEFILNKDQIYNAEFELSSKKIREVTVTGEKNIVEKTQTSVIDVPIEQIRTIPALLGEVDVLKAIQLLPGVQSSEGTSGFYVRGGGPDQNLILLDGVPVYNASHIAGLFSVFNADAIKTVRLTKGGFPARYGGRLSSVLQIDMKEGNMKKFKTSMSTGIISSKLVIEGPIIKDKTSFILSGRRTYIDLLMRPFLPDATLLNLYFYDLNAKINHKFSNKDRIYLSAYTGRDVFNIGYDGGKDNSSESNDERFKFGLGYGNITSTLRWNHLFSDKLFSNLTLTYSKYDFNYGIEAEDTYSTGVGNESFEFDYRYISGIEDLAGRIDFDYIPNPNHEIKFGASYTHHYFFPGKNKLDIEINSPDIGQNIDTLLEYDFLGSTNADEMFVYVEDNIQISNRLKANVGMHLGYYSSGNSNFGDLDNYSFEPRISARYLLADEWSIKSSYAAMRQNIHLLSNTSVGFPSDIWVPAIDSVPSQTSHQWAASLNTQLYGGEYELSLEGYYKTMHNLIAYKAGYRSLDGSEGRSWSDAVETGGEGKSYGVELFLQKKKRNTTGWIGYTLSWTKRQFDNLNFGDWYPYKYDRRHDLSIVLSHTFNKRQVFSKKVKVKNNKFIDPNQSVSIGTPDTKEKWWNISATWVYGTGNAITFPQAIYFGMPENEWGDYIYVDDVESYGERNSARMPAYHRLDIGFNSHTRRSSGVESVWSFGAYNAYNRKNPYFAYLGYTNNNERVAQQVSLFGRIPSISYQLTF